MELNTYSYTNINLTKELNIVVRSCLNVTLDSDGNVLDNSRIVESSKLIKELGGRVNRVVILAHLGRPTKYSKEFSFVNVVKELEKEVNKGGNGLSNEGDNNLSITLVNTLEELENLVNQNAKGIYLLENIRFNSEEESSDLNVRSEFGKRLSKLGDIFINDSFADYRESASNYDIVKNIPSYLGPVFINEINNLNKLKTPRKPYIAILGGAKLSEKIDILNSLLSSCDKVLIGGAMSYTILKAKGINVGNSLIEEDKLDVAVEILNKYSDKLVLPIDHLVSNEFDEKSSYEYINEVNISDNRVAIDIGWETIKLFKDEILKANTILWNGPMGVFEWEHSSVGTVEIAKAIVNNVNAYKVVGGGDSITALNKFNILGFDHISTGGGAMIKYLSGDEFKTLEVILNQSNN